MGQDLWRKSGSATRPVLGVQWDAAVNPESRRVFDLFGRAARGEGLAR